MTQLRFGIGPQVPMFRMQYIKHLAGVGSALKVTCTRCGNWFIVNPLAWRRASDYQTRPCPHCFRVSAITKGEQHGKHQPQ